LGAAAAYWAYKVRGAVWLKIAKVSLTVSVVTLALPFVPALGKDIKGNRNWIEFAGFTLQPSEFAKFGLILWSAYHLRNLDLFKDTKKSLFFLVPGFFIIEFFIILQKDLGTALLVFLIFTGILFAAGAPIKFFIGSFAALLDPFDDRYYKFTGWQPAHSIMGLASGGLWGSGLGASKQKWANLAEAHTDFIFSVIGEELGLLGSLLVLCLYAALIYAIIRVALKTKDDFSRYVSAAIACWFIAQIAVNIGSATSLVPVIGVTLPFISYGGSSLLANLIAVGYVLGVARRTPEIAEGIKANRVRKLS
jgi:cell division protein FtsW